jgi:hypothetical protein
LSTAALKTLQKIGEDFKSANEKLAVIEQATRVQAENHLCTIQAESIKQTALLETMIKEQATTNGYLKAVVEVAKK